MKPIKWGLRYIIAELRFNAKVDTLFQRMSINRLEDLEKEIVDTLKVWENNVTPYVEGYKLGLVNILGDFPNFKCFGEMTQDGLMDCKDSCEANKWCLAVTNRKYVITKRILDQGQTLRVCPTCLGYSVVMDRDCQQCHSEGWVII